LESGGGSGSTREEQESALLLIAPKEDGTEELCEALTDDDAEGGASEWPGRSAA